MSTTVLLSCSMLFKVPPFEWRDKNTLHVNEHNLKVERLRHLKNLCTAGILISYLGCFLNANAMCKSRNLSVHQFGREGLKRFTQDLKGTGL